VASGSLERSSDPSEVGLRSVKTARSSHNSNLAGTPCPLTVFNVLLTTSPQYIPCRKRVNFAYTLGGVEKSAGSPW